MVYSLEDTIIKRIEYMRGMYRYPNKMVGRQIPSSGNQIDILVFAAHQDDDILGLSTVLQRHASIGDKITVIYTTNGSGGNGPGWRRRFKYVKHISEIRYEEASQALSLIGLSKGNVICLGYPDRGTYRYLENMAKDVSNLIGQLNPKRIYVHNIEGGHIDHDITSFVVQSVCKKIHYSEVFEWTEYRQNHQLGTELVSFPPTKSNNSEEIRIEISNNERSLKKKMLACHKSQKVDVFSQQGEAIRQADFSDLEFQFKTYATLAYSAVSNRRMLPIVSSFNQYMDELKHEIRSAPTNSRKDYPLTRLF